MPHKSTNVAISIIGIDLGKNSFHLVGLDKRGAIALQIKLSRGRLERHNGCTMTASLPEKTRGGRKRPPRCLFGRYANHTLWS